MWFPMWLWLIPLMFFLAGRCGRRNRERSRAGAYVGALQRTVDDQSEYIEQLEARLSRVEEGLEFAERLLAQRGSAA